MPGYVISGRLFIGDCITVITTYNIHCYISSVWPTQTLSDVTHIDENCLIRRPNLANLQVAIADLDMDSAWLAI